SDQRQAEQQVRPDDDSGSDLSEVLHASDRNSFNRENGEAAAEGKPHGGASRQDPKRSKHHGTGRRQGGFDHRGFAPSDVPELAKGDPLVVPDAGPEGGGIDGGNP